MCSNAWEGIVGCESHVGLPVPAKMGDEAGGGGATNICASSSAKTDDMRRIASHCVALRRCVAQFPRKFRASRSGLELLRRELQIKRESCEKLQRHLEMTRPGSVEMLACAISQTRHLLGLSVSAFKRL